MRPGCVRWIIDICIVLYQLYVLGAWNIFVLGLVPSLNCLYCFWSSEGFADARPDVGKTIPHMFCHLRIVLVPQKTQDMFPLLTELNAHWSNLVCAVRNPEEHR